MNWFLNLRTAGKLLLGFGLILGLLVLVVAVANREIAAVAQSQEVARLAVEVENDLNANRATVLLMLTETDPQRLRTLQGELRKQSGETEALMQRLRNAAKSPELIRSIERFATPREEYVRIRDTGTVRLLLDGKTAEARALSLGPQQARYQVLRDLSRDLSMQAQATAARQIAQTQTTLVTIGVVAFLVAGAIVALLAWLIGAPLRKITALAERIALGDLTEAVDMDGRRDEVGQLASAFGRMTRGLRDMANVADRIAEGDLTVTVRPQSERDVLGSAFAVMVQKMRAVTAELAEGINILSSSVSQISASTSQFAASATETAVAISETTTTVEEVRQTAQVSSQKARLVSESAQKVTTVAESGQRSTEGLNAGMDRIQQQMESIAESMVRLSDQSQAIGQIVAAVEDLAGQSKLLAVNASIEAVKAGEHGKGFAVVAQEVKSLAEQSRQATAQVRTILGEIQRATNAAVLVTEQGTAAVEDGVRQSEQAAQSIQALAGSVVEAAQAAVQIAASSQQQLVGVDQVASAMESIKTASSQNVDSAKQLESAAVSIKVLGERLKGLAAAYRV